MPSVRPVALAYNTVYLVEDAGQAVLVDTGPDYRGARETIAEAIRPRRPTAVIATHGHLDHAGLGSWWQEAGVPVALGRADLPQALGHADADIDRMEDYIRQSGAPPLVQIEAIEGLEARRRWAHDMRTSREWRPSTDGRWPTALRYPPFEPLQVIDGETGFPCGLRALPSPGHTPGNLVAVHKEEGWLFSGDQLLPEITPTPAIQFAGEQRFHSLPEFLASLEALRAMHLARCFPGHGQPFDNVDEVIAANLAQAESRTERLDLALRQFGESTLYSLAEHLYPRALARRFWQIISTIQGHLDVLERQGRAAFDGARWRPL